MTGHDGWQGGCSSFRPSARGNSWPQCPQEGTTRGTDQTRPKAAHGCLGVRGGPGAGQPHSGAYCPPPGLTGDGEGETSGLDPDLTAPSVNQVLVLCIWQGSGFVSWGPTPHVPDPSALLSTGCDEAKLDIWISSQDRVGPSGVVPTTNSGPTPPGMLSPWATGPKQPWAPRERGHFSSWLHAFLLVHLDSGLGWVSGAPSEGPQSLGQQQGGHQ